MAALRAAELGLKVLILEKAQKFGGTSATSGGVMWIPNHQLDGDKGDSREAALEYLDATIGVPVNRKRLEAFVDEAPKMLHFLKSTGVQVMAAAWPDYLRSEEHTSELQSLMRISYAVFCLKKKKTKTIQ